MNRAAAVVAFIAGVLTATGAAWFSPGAGLIVAGCWLAAWTVLFLLEVK